jgi:hypothetical protein
MEFPTCFFKECNRKATSLCLLPPHRSHLAAVWSVFVHNGSCHWLPITDVTYVYSHISYGTLEPYDVMKNPFLLKTFLTPMSVAYGLSFDAQPDIYWPFCSEKKSYRTRVKQKCGNFEDNSSLKQCRCTRSVVISAVYSF